MSGILRMDFHRLFRSLILYILPLILLLVLIVSALGDNEPSQTGLDAVLDMVTGMISNVIFLAADIILVYIWNGERRHGYIKNIAGNVSGRHVLPLSKTVGIFAVCLIYTFVSIAFSVTGTLVTGGTIVSAPIDSQIRDLILWFIAGLASGAIMLFLYELTHSQTLCFIAAIMMWTVMIDNLVVQLAYLLLKIDWVGRYLLFSGLNWEEAGYAEKLIKALVYFVVFTVAAVFVARKKDVNT